MRLAEQAAVFPDLMIAPPEPEGLDARDAALAHAIQDAVIRRWLTLSFLLDLHLKQPLRENEPALQAILLSGAAQLMFFDRLPPHAVLNESVELAKIMVRPGAAGVVNAVLRRIAEAIGGHEARTTDWHQRRDVLPLADGRVLVLKAPLLPEDPQARLAIGTSHPREYIAHLTGVHRGEVVRDFALHNLAAPPTILNTVHARPPLPQGLTAHSEAGHHVFEGTRAELLDILESRSDLWVQDPASTRAVRAVAELQPRVIVDLCAGQGTKTRQLAATFPGARIIATDVDKERHFTLTRVFAGSEQVEVLRPEEVRPRLAGRADLVLLDVPCTNTGVLARRPEAKYRASRQQLDRLVEIQRGIIAEALPLLSQNPRGRILYSTCSIDREENQFQVDWAAREFGLRVQRHELALPEGLPGEAPSSYRDGSFYAVLA